MNVTDISNALKARVGNAGLVWPIAWPNQDVPSPAPQPRIELTIDRNTDDDAPLSGGLIRSDGFIRALCIVQKGTSTDAVETKAQELRDLLPKALRLPVSGGYVTITNVARVAAGFRDGSDWVVPVIIPYRAEAD